MINKKIDGCKNNPENLFSTKVSEYIPSGFSMSTISSFKIIKNKNDVCRGKDCMKKFCESLPEHALETINFKKKKIKLLTEEYQETYENEKVCSISKEKFENKYVKVKKYYKVLIIVIMKRNKDTVYLKKIAIAFHNGLNYDYHFITKS